MSNEIQEVIEELAELQQEVKSSPNLTAQQRIEILELSRVLMVQLNITNIHFKALEDCINSIFKK